MASTRIARMIWVIVSVWICCMRGQQRRLIPIDDDDGEHHSNLNLNLNHDLNLDLDRCGSDDEQCQSGAADRSLLDGELLVYVRNGQTSVPVEVDFMATVGDLRRTYAEAVGISAASVDFEYQGKKMGDDGETLADIGVAMEAMVDVVIQSNDIDDFLRFIGDSMITSIWPDEQLREDTLREIQRRKQLALQAAAGPDNVDFSDVIKYINSECDMITLRSNSMGRIGGFLIDNDSEQWRGQQLNWQYLPQQTRSVTLYHGSDLEQISLAGIECAKLETLEIWDMPNLSHVDLQGIEKCTELRVLRLSKNPVLQALDLSPLGGHRSLQSVLLYANGLTALDVKPLTACPALRYVDLKHNAFSDAQRAEIKMTLENAGLTEVLV